MDLENKITEELKLAMKSKDKLVLTALRAIKSELMIAKTNAGQKKIINNEIELKILQKLVKQKQFPKVVRELMGKQRATKSLPKIR